MLNVVVLIGRLARDPEARYTVNGTAVTKFTMAVDRPFTNREGERDADFLDVVCWRKLAETVANNLRKGRLVAVQGRIQKDTWQTDEGEYRSRVEVVANNVRFLDWPDDERGSRPQPQKEEDDSFDDVDDFDDLDDDDLDPVPFD